MTDRAARADISEHLRLLMSRLNLSNVELAHRIGVDKSVVRRWVSGTTRPMEINISALTEIAAREIPGFTRDHWRMEHSDFLVALGLGKAAPPVSGLETLLPRFAGRARESVAQGLDRYGGLWAVVFTVADQTGGQALFCSGVLISERDGHLWASVSDGRNGIRSLEGPAFVADDMLWLMQEEQASRNDLCITLAFGAVGKALVLDGLFLIRSFVGGHPVSGRGTFFRLTDLPDNSEQAQSLFAAISDRAGVLSRQKLAQILPAPLTQRLFGGEAGSTARFPFITALDGSASLATLAIAADMLADDVMTRREMLESVQSLFSPLL